MQFSDDALGSMDAHDRLAVLDSEGIDLAIQFPQRAMSMSGIADRDFMFTCLNSYNEWLAHGVPRRMGAHGVPILPTVYRPQATAEYIAHLKALGFKTMMLPNYPRDVRYADAEMEPMWNAIEESGLPLNFHISEAPDDNGPGGLGTFLTVSMQPFRKLWAYLVFTGLLDRHPGLRVVFTEGGISWVPSVLEHADRVHREFADYLEPRLPTRQPLLDTQCYATFMDIRAASNRSITSGSTGACGRATIRTRGHLRRDRRRVETQPRVAGRCGSDSDHGRERAACLRIRRTMSVEVTPIARSLGAIVSGVDLRER